MLNNKVIDWTQLIQLTNSGFQIADFVTIRKAVTERFKEIYGEDIDLSTGTADGDYIMMYSLIINNILQSFKTMYANLNVNEATGQYLDILSALTNVYRKAATKSTCSLDVTLDETRSSNYVTDSISFIDINGNVWTAKASDYQLPNNQFTFVPGQTQSIIVTCEKPGSINAEAGTEDQDYENGWIDRLVEAAVVMKIQQRQNAIPGQAEETDAQLRQRRSVSTGTRSASVLNGLIGALYGINGIDDVKIYNNASASSITAKNTTSIPPHSVYVLVRRHQNTFIEDSIVGTTIYEAMTPGVLTVNGSSTFATPKSFTYEQYFLDSTAYLDYPQNVYWSEVKTVNSRIDENCKIKITITPRQNFASADNSTCIKIAQALIQFCNALRIGVNLECRDIYDVVDMADPLFKGRPTFDIDSVKILNNVIPMSATAVTSNDEVFYYTQYDIVENNGNYEITIS